jgi:DNA-binding MarR family transcriptional regulator
MRLERQKLIQQAIQAKRVFSSALHASTVPDWIQLELSMAQVKGLFFLESVGSSTIGNVAAGLAIGQPAASLLIDRLVQGNFVARQDDPTDRRRTFVGLTPNGESLVEQLRHGVDEYYHALLDQLGDDDLTALVQGLEALARIAPKNAISIHCRRKSSVDHVGTVAGTYSN